MKIVLAGGTGFVGRVLLKELLDENHQVVLLARNPKKVSGGRHDRLTVAVWDGVSAGDWVSHVEGADAIINLSGDSVAEGRWTASKKKRILESRVNSTRVLVNARQQARKKPSIFINASAVGYYGNVDEGNVTETASKGTGFLADTCETWEREARQAQEEGARLVLLRIGVVLGKGGGALKKMVPPFKMFAGGPLGSGQQWLPWVHIDDVAGAILHALSHDRLSGPINVVGPQAVNNKEFSKVLGEVLHRPSWAPVPGFMLKLMLGEMSEMLLGGQKAVPAKLEKSGYTFRHPDLKEALKHILT